MALLRWTVFLVLVAGATGWILSRAPAAPAAYDTLTGDPEAGRLSFAAAGCASCHVGPDAEEGEGPPILSGGQRFETDYGTFVAPNISPAPQGVGDWTDAELIHAIASGVSPDGRHYYPAFPYTAYHKADPQDLADIVAHLRTLPPSEAESAPHELSFPWSLRRGAGLWKRMFLSEDFVLQEAETPEIERGRYLVEALGHCGECHTPRTATGALDTGRWLSGAPNPSGEGRIPDITPAGLSWSKTDIVAYLETGFTPDFDVAGGSMAAVVRNTARLPAEDRVAIAAYLKAIPAAE